MLHRRQCLTHMRLESAARTQMKCRRWEHTVVCYMRAAPSGSPAHARELAPLRRFSISLRGGYRVHL
jgi:hypothetical protein